MVYFSSLFLEAKSNELEYKGKIVQRFFRFNKPGRYLFKFTFVSTNSKYNQAIVVFYDDFEGEIYLCNKDISKKKNRFSHFSFYEDTAPKHFELEIHMNAGSLEICNGVDIDGKKRGCTTLAWGCALIIEEIENNRYRFLCNDHDNDDDFDDLIFELEIQERTQGDG